MDFKYTNKAFTQSPFAKKTKIELLIANPTLSIT